MKQLQKKIKPVAMSIAGLDPSAYAGVYSDIKVFNEFGIRCLGVPTVFTIQNDSSFKYMEPLGSNLFRETLVMMFESYKVDAIKIGLLNNLEQVDVILEMIDKYKPRLIALDTIIASSSGFVFWDTKTMKSIVERLLPKVDVITPNYNEAVKILEFIGKEEKDGLLIARQFNKLFRVKIALTGGDNSVEGKIEDVYYDGSASSIRTADYFDIPRELKHGTGCVFSSALTAGLFNGLDFIPACEQAALFTESQLRSRTNESIY